MRNTIFRIHIVFINFLLSVYIFKREKAFLEEDFHHFQFHIVWNYAINPIVWK